MTSPIDRLIPFIERSDLTRNKMERTLNHRGRIRGWESLGQDPQIQVWGDFCDLLGADPGKTAYGVAPQPAYAKHGYNAEPIDMLSPNLEKIYRVWKQSGFGLPFCVALAEAGLADGFYVIGTEDNELKYEHVGERNLYTMGVDWWDSCLGKFVGEDDPYPDFAYGCLEHYKQSLKDNKVARHRLETVLKTGPWAWDRLCIPEADKVLVVNEIRP